MHDVNGDNQSTSFDCAECHEGISETCATCPCHDDLRERIVNSPETEERRKCIESLCDQYYDSGDLFLFDDLEELLEEELDVFATIMRLQRNDDPLFSDFSPWQMI